MERKLVHFHSNPHVMGRIEIIQTSLKEGKEELCTALCAVTGSNGVGKCKTEGQTPYCCCVRNPSSIGVHQLVQ
ncbi:hypothetical protein ACP70R_003774 [Stipagrostis hirtigluma subsp. patula]